MKATREDGRGYPGYIFKRGRIGSGNGPLNLGEAAPREDRSFLSRIHGLFDSRPTMRRLVRGHITDIVCSGRLSRVYEERERERGNKMDSPYSFSISLLYSARPSSSQYQMARYDREKRRKNYAESIVSPIKRCFRNWKIEWRNRCDEKFVGRSNDDTNLER